VRCLADAAINITIARGAASVGTTAYNRYVWKKTPWRRQGGFAAPGV